jgi:hypothetical protein
MWERFKLWCAFWHTHARCGACGKLQLKAEMFRYGTAYTCDNDQCPHEYWCSLQW